MSPVGVVFSSPFLLFDVDLAEKWGEIIVLQDFAIKRGSEGGMIDWSRSCSTWSCTMGRILNEDEILWGEDLMFLKAWKGGSSKWKASRLIYHSVEIGVKGLAWYDSEFLVLEWLSRGKG